MTIATCTRRSRREWSMGLSPVTIPLDVTETSGVWFEAIGLYLYLFCLLRKPTVARSVDICVSLSRSVFRLAVETLKNWPQPSSIVPRSWNETISGVTFLVACSRVLVALSCSKHPAHCMHFVRYGNSRTIAWQDELTAIMCVPQSCAESIRECSDFRAGVYMRISSCCKRHYGPTTTLILDFLLSNMVEAPTLFTGLKQLSNTSNELTNIGLPCTVLQTHTFGVN